MIPPPYPFSATRGIDTPDRYFYFRSLLLIPFQQTLSRLRTQGLPGEGDTFGHRWTGSRGWGEPTIVLPTATRVLLYIPDLIGDWLLLPLPRSLIDTV
jgi:hypothetical protein